MKVAVIMGSQSDLKVTQKGLDMLNHLGVDYELKVISAHRALDVLVDAVNRFEEDGIEVVIALAGKAAHLPGVIAGMSILPVIGVPILGSALTGLDSLLSIVQMPKGVPVATVAVDGAENAAILATQILSVKYPELKKRLKEYKEELKADVLRQNESVA